MGPGRPSETLSPGRRKSRRPPVTPRAPERLPALGGELTAPAPEPPAPRAAQPAPSTPPGPTPHAPPSTRLSPAAGVRLTPADTQSAPCAPVGWSRRSPGRRDPRISPRIFRLAGSPSDGGGSGAWPLARSVALSTCPGERCSGAAGERDHRRRRSKKRMARERGGGSAPRPSDGSQARLTFWVRSEAPPPPPSEPGGPRRGHPAVSPRGALTAVLGAGWSRPLVSPCPHACPPRSGPPASWLGQTAAGQDGACWRWQK